ncbi:XRE family transcriptional regulator [Dechloromonas sp. HYN0024]|uniref:XRE family transcriptional regulator n=1 Tax=Dechloromonas sp. HYN0024 TaxID=2231055 RepID=UPI001F08634E|nr:XRE family transcriptional regulator [Dechloromonas sp. HYN0024]
MTYKEFRRLLGKAGLTAKEFAHLLSLNPNSITNYSSHGEVPPHFAIIVSLMGAMADQGIDFKEVISGITIPNKRTENLRSDYQKTSISSGQI